MTFKNPQFKINLDQKLCQFLLFHCDVIFDKLSRLGQISCLTPYYIELKDPYIRATFFVNLLKIWYKMRKIIA